MKSRIPKYIHGAQTPRQWRALKRKQLKKVKDALEVYQRGCAFCPGYPEDSDRLWGTLRVMLKSHSVRKWG